jgi:hypothetical protein
VLLVGLVGLGYFLLRAPDTAVLPPPATDEHGASDREDAAAELLEDLTQALTEGSRKDALALAAPGDDAARAELSDLVANVRRLGVTDLAMRYVDENAGRHPAGAAPRLADRAWVGDVQLDWKVRRYDEGDSHLEVTMVFLQTPDGAAFVTARNDYGEQAPLWLLERLTVLSGPRALAAVAGDRAEARRFASLADRAVLDVRKVFPGWKGRLVVEVPSTQDDLNRVLTSDTSYDAIAAVTAPVDGSLSPSAPTHVYVNPPVFSPLGAQGSQIVMSHEATHVATDAAISSMPTWLLEGFADYVALAHVDLPVEVTASQILKQVRKDGPPRTLPTQDDFASENTTLGASYEAAWLACRLISQTYGEDKLVAFYDRADRDDSTTAAFRSVLGTTERQFTARWREQLRELAG